MSEETVEPFAEFVHSGHRIKFEIPNPDDFIQKMLLTNKHFYEEALLMDAASFLTPGDLCIDVGANLGNHTVFFAKVCRANVIAVEPNRENLDLLKKNLAHNDIESLVCAKWVAAGQEPGWASLQIRDPNNTGTAQVRHESESGDIEVIRIDDLELPKAVALIKVDVEGMELEVLKGALKTLERDRPVLYVEASKQHEFAAVEKFLAGIGYAQMTRFNATATYRFDTAHDAVAINRAFLRSIASIKTELREIGLKVRRLPTAEKD